MPKAFIMIDCVAGRDEAVRAQVAKLAGVKMVYAVTGAPDLVAFVDAEPYEEFAVILSTIRQIEGVRDTESLLVLDAR